MTNHTAIISWTRSGPDFLKGQYSREHTWKFDGGLTVPASPSPAVVPEPYSQPANIDPEEAFVAAISSCHMLTFLFLASRQKFLVDGYRDEAVGVLTEIEPGVAWISRVTLRPRVRYGGDRVPTAGEEDHLHQLAHAQCYIANSVKTQIIVER